MRFLLPAICSGDHRFRSRHATASKSGSPAATPLRGRHNVENVLAASIAAARAGVSHAGIASAVGTFRAVEHRLEFVRSVSGVEFYNDSKATSVDATLVALESL